MFCTGGWWSVERSEEVTGTIAIEVRPYVYVTALDNGLFTTGAPHDEGLNNWWLSASNV